jgi:hypothetical protein
METKKNNFRWLTWAVILHLFSLGCSIYGDMVRKWPTGYREINYWFYFFSWWCAWCSLITIIYFIYRLFKNSSSNYFDKIFDLVVINANIITISIFTVSALAGLTPLPKSNETIKVFLWEINFKLFTWFYFIIWHYLAPIFTITYFARQKKNLIKTYSGRKKLFAYSFFHPLLYFIFVLVRPLIPGSEKFIFNSKLPNYPYFFFNWVGISEFGQIFWAVVVILFWLLIFWFSTLFFCWYSGHKIKTGRGKIIF